MRMIWENIDALSRIRVGHAVRHFKAVMSHKKLVYRFGRELGVSRFQLLLHDISKFTPTEFLFYAAHLQTEGLDLEAEERELNRQNYEYVTAFIHTKRNKHHWNYWVSVYIVETVGRIYIADMPDKYIREMVADWMAVGMRLAPTTDPRLSAKVWYMRNRHAMHMTPRARRVVNTLLGITLDELI